MHHHIRNLPLYPHSLIIVCCFFYCPMTHLSTIYLFLIIILDCQSSSVRLFVRWCSGSKCMARKCPGIDLRYVTCMQSIVVTWSCITLSLWWPPLFSFHVYTQICCFPWYTHTCHMWYLLFKPLYYPLPPSFHPSLIPLSSLLSPLSHRIIVVFLACLFIDRCVWCVTGQSSVDIVCCAPCVRYFIVFDCWFVCLSVWLCVCLFVWLFIWINSSCQQPQKYP